MFVRSSILTAAAALLASTTAFAGPVGDVTLIDPAIVHSGTVAIGPTLSYVSGSNGATGTADGSTWTNNFVGPSAALALADHVWAQFDPAILFYSATATSSLLAIPAIDHGWEVNNNGEGWEPFEFQIFGLVASMIRAQRKTRTTGPHAGPLVASIITFC
jgi:hypothetical protein